MTYYDILNVRPNASAEEIKISYQKLILVHHPDKSSEVDAAETFRKILEAWRVLSVPESRKLYDQELLRASMDVVYGELTDLSEFEKLESESLFVLQCRCGGCYEISQEELDQGHNTIQCSDCSLYRTIHVT